MRRTPLRSLAIAASILLTCLAAPASASPGELDPTFGNAGLATLPPSWLVDMAIQPNGKILTLGSDRLSYPAHTNYVARLDRSGAPDPTFGEGGIAPLPAGAPRRMMALQPGHGILIAGEQAGVIRLRSNGTPDRSFGVSGTAEAMDPAQGLIDISAITVQADGRFLIAGVNRRPSQRDALFVARYTAEGFLDRSFSVDGVRRVLTDCSYLSPCPSAAALAALPNGKILVIGGHQLPSVVRFLANGKLDPHFGPNGDGMTIGSLPSAMRDFNALTGLIQPGGGIIDAGYVTGGGLWQGAMVRFHADGTFDPSFGSGGLATFDADPTQPSGAGAVQGSIQHLALTPTGTIVTGGTEIYIEDPDHLDIQDLVVAVFNPNGTIRESFGNAGVVLIDALDPGVMDPNRYTEQRMVGGVAAQDDGKIVMAAARFEPDPAKTFVVRLQAP